MAINAKELRIGNWVKGPLGEVMQVDILGHLEEPDYVHARNENTCGQNGFEPIPLTPEILEKCGFSNNGEYDYFMKDEYDDDNKKIILHDMTDVDEAFEVYIYKHKHFLTTIKYLHKLQNLYFALTATELEVKINA